MGKTALYSMRLDAKLRAKLQKLADKENRSLANFIETKLWEVVEDAR